MIAIPRNLKKTAFASILGGLAMFVATTQAHAGFTVTLASSSPSGSNTTYNYTASIPTDDMIVNGDFFRIYDFGGYVPGTITAPAGWTAITQLSTPTPPPSVILTHGDDPAISNLIFTYTGSTSILGPVTITGFSATSTTNTASVIKDFVGTDTKAAGSVGSKVDAIGSIFVPAAVPEPSSLISTSLGVIALGFLYARRNRSRLHSIA